MRGELNAIRAQHGQMTPSEDYTSRERFLELEAQYEAFHEYFKEQWKLTKKQIRKEILWSKNNKRNTYKIILYNLLCIIVNMLWFTIKIRNKFNVFCISSRILYKINI